MSSTQRRIPSYDTEGGIPRRTTPHPDHESDPVADMATPPVPRPETAPALSPARPGNPPTAPSPPAPPLRPSEDLQGITVSSRRPRSGHYVQIPTSSSPSYSFSRAPQPPVTPTPRPVHLAARAPQPPVAPIPTPLPAHLAVQQVMTTTNVRPSDIETLASWRIPTARNWPELNHTLTGPTPRAVVVLSPDRSFFAVTTSTMRTLLRTAQHTIAMGLNAHMAQFTLEPSDIPTARNHTELMQFFLAHSAVMYDGYYAVKPSILAPLLCCFGASDPDLAQTDDDAADDADDDDDDGEVPRTGSFSSAC